MLSAFCLFIQLFSSLFEFTLIYTFLSFSVISTMIRISAYFIFYLFLLFCFSFLFIESSNSLHQLIIGISSLTFEIPDKIPCNLRQCFLDCALLLELSRGSASCILLFIMSTVIHNCLSLGSFSSQHLGGILRENMTNMNTVANLYYH